MTTGRRTTPATYFGTLSPPPSALIIDALLRRPETVESLFIAYRLTGDNRFRDYGWDIFQSIEKYCRIDSGGYASILDVNHIPVQYEDKMETFLMVSAFALSAVLNGRVPMLGTERNFQVSIPSLRRRARPAIG